MLSKEQENKIKTLLKELMRVWEEVDTNESLSVTVNNGYISYFAIDENGGYITRYTEIDGESLYD